MTPYQFEGAVIGYIGALLIAVLCVIGYLWAEWQVSREDRERRKKPLMGDTLIDAVGELGDPVATGRVKSSWRQQP